MNITTDAREAVHAVQQHMGERVPNVRYMLLGRRELAELCVSASGYQAERAARDRYFRHAYRDARTTIGVTVPTPRGIVVALRVDRIRRDLDQLWPTLVHELVHAVQFTRPGTRERWLQGQLHNLELAPLGRREAREASRLQARDEAEAVRIEAALAC